MRPLKQNDHETEDSHPAVSIDSPRTVDFSLATSIALARDTSEDVARNESYLPKITMSSLLEKLLKSEIATMTTSEASEGSPD